MIPNLTIGNLTTKRRVIIDHRTYRSLAFRYVALPLSDGKRAGTRRTTDIFHS
jgi:hypothetical protein